MAVAHYLAWALRDIGRHAEARELDEDTLARSRRVLGDDHPDTLGTAGALAADLMNLGEYQAARELDEDTLARKRRVLGDDHPDTLASIGNLAVDLRALGRDVEAEALEAEVRRRRAPLASAATPLGKAQLPNRPDQPQDNRT